MVSAPITHTPRESRATADTDRLAKEDESEPLVRHSFVRACVGAKNREGARCRGGNDGPTGEEKGER